jgi:hypothetical protein
MTSLGAGLLGQNEITLGQAMPPNQKSKQSHLSTYLYTYLSSNIGLTSTEGHKLEHFKCQLIFL